MVVVGMGKSWVTYACVLITDCSGTERSVFCACSLCSIVQSLELVYSDSVIGVLSSAHEIPSGETTSQDIIDHLQQFGG